MSISRTRTFLVLLLALALGFAGLTTASNATAQAKSKIKTVQVGGKKKHVAVARGKQVRIELTTAIDGGYSWAVTHRPKKSVATIGKARVVPGKNAKGSVGAPAHTFYRITAKGYGATTLKLVERRSFDHSDVARRVTITIVVPRYPAFYGSWSGHTRYLYIGRTGKGTEHVGSGCCDPIIDLSFQLSHARTVKGAKVATARVTRVKVYEGWKDTGRRAPRVGDTGTVRIRNGVLYEHISDTYFCDARQSAKGTCGA